MAEARHELHWGDAQSSFFPVADMTAFAMLQLVPVQLVRAYRRAMLNIHPALLPAFGGKGFYGERVHKVRQAGHNISEHYHQD